jgi:hypothetical protein
MASDQKELIMAKWNDSESRKASSYPAVHPEHGSVAAATRTSISAGDRSQSRYRYDARMDNPRGWRSSFIGF